jgi:hypothetical protein
VRFCFLLRWSSILISTPHNETSYTLFAALGSLNPLSPKYLCIPPAPRPYPHYPSREKLPRGIVRISSLGIAVGYPADILLPLSPRSLCSTQAGLRKLCDSPLVALGVWRVGVIFIPALLLLPEARRFEGPQNAGVTE